MCVVGQNTPVNVTREVNVNVTEPHTGSGSSAKQTKDFVQNERMLILAQDFGNIQGGSGTNVTWVLSENPADKKGILSSFQGVVILDSTSPFMLGIKVFADIPSSKKDWLILSEKGAEGMFYIDPMAWKARASIYKTVEDFHK